MNFTLPETRVPELHDGCYSIGLSVFKFTQLFSKAKKRRSRRAACWPPYSRGRVPIRNLGRGCTSVRRISSRGPAAPSVPIDKQNYLSEGIVTDYLYGGFQ